MENKDPNDENMQNVFPYQTSAHTSRPPPCRCRHPNAAALRPSTPKPAPKRASAPTRKRPGVKASRNPTPTLWCPGTPVTGCPASRQSGAPAAQALATLCPADPGTPNTSAQAPRCPGGPAHKPTPQQHRIGTPKRHAEAARRSGTLKPQMRIVSCCFPFVLQ